MARDIRVLNMADGQKIEPDLVMKRIGELEYRNMGTFAKMFLFDSGKALVVGSGLRVEPSLGMIVNVPSGIVFQRSVDVILPCIEPTAQVVTVDAASGSPRIDIIEAQVKVVSDKSDTVQVMSVPSGSTSVVTLEEVKRDMRYYLSARKKTGSTTPTAATAAELEGTVAIATTIDLTEKYLLNLCNGEDGDYQEIDLRGANPALTTRAEIIALINAAVGYTMASTGTGNVIVLTGEGTGQSSYFAIQPPVTDADKDALEIVFGVSAGGAYRWPYVGNDEWFKLAEIDVGASTTTLTDTEIRNIDEKSTWTDGDDVLLMYHANELGLNINNAIEKTTPADADMVGLIDSAASNILKKLSWANIKATILAYLNSVGITAFKTNDGSVLRTKIIQIGDWNMDSTSSVTIAHGLTLSKIRRVFITIIKDGSQNIYSLEFDDGGGGAGVFALDASNIVLGRKSAGLFDDVLYDSTSFNRGFITIDYID